MRNFTNLIIFLKIKKPFFKLKYFFYNYFQKLYFQNRIKPSKMTIQTPSPPKIPFAKI